MVAFLVLESLLEVMLLLLAVFLAGTTGQTRDERARGRVSELEKEKDGVGAAEIGVRGVGVEKPELTGVNVDGGALAEKAELACDARECG